MAKVRAEFLLDEQVKSALKRLAKQMKISRNQLMEKASLMLMDNQEFIDSEIEITLRENNLKNKRSVLKMQGRNCYFTAMMFKRIIRGQLNSLFITGDVNMREVEVFVDLSQEYFELLSPADREIAREQMDKIIQLKNKKYLKDVLENQRLYISKTKTVTGNVLIEQSEKRKKHEYMMRKKNGSNRAK